MENFFHPAGRISNRMEADVNLENKSNREEADIQPCRTIINTKNTNGELPAQGPCVTEEILLLVLLEETTN